MKKLYITIAVIVSLIIISFCALTFSNPQSSKTAYMWQRWGTFLGFGLECLPCDEQLWAEHQESIKRMKEPTLRLQRLRPFYVRFIEIEQPDTNFTGTWRSWNYEGNLSFVCEYTDGDIDGWRLHYHDNGKLKRASYRFHDTISGKPAYYGIGFYRYGGLDYIQIQPVDGGLTYLVHNVGTSNKLQSSEYDKVSDEMRVKLAEFRKKVEE